MIMNDQERTTSIEFGVPNKFQQVDEFVNTESTNNEDGLYLTQGARYSQILPTSIAQTWTSQNGC